MDSLVSGWDRDLSWSSPHSVGRESWGHPQLPYRPSLLPPATFPLSSPPLSVFAPPLPPSVEPPEPEAGESRDIGVRRGLLERAKPGGAPGYRAGGGEAEGGREGGSPEGSGWGRGGLCGGGGPWGSGPGAVLRGEVNDTCACLSLCLSHPLLYTSIWSPVSVRAPV